MTKREKEISYFHFRSGDGHRGGVTVAYYTSADKPGVGLAFCSPKDVYNKKLGRTIASGRLEINADTSESEGFYGFGFCPSVVYGASSSDTVRNIRNMLEEMYAGGEDASESPRWFREFYEEVTKAELNNTKSTRQVMAAE